jgi:hypothetical protein
MLKWITSPLAWVAANAAVLIALSSFVVAGLTFYFGRKSDDINNENIDRFFVIQEKLVTPYVELTYDTTLYNAVLSNKGIGPAVISRIGLESPDFCIQSKGLNAQQWSLLKSSVQDKTTSYAYSDVIAYLEDKLKTHFQPIFNMDLLGPGELIEVGGTRNLFQLLYANNPDFSKMDSDIARGATEKWLGRMGHLTLLLEYCSITGAYCARMGPDRFGC